MSRQIGNISEYRLDVSVAFSAGSYTVTVLCPMSRQIGNISLNVENDGWPSVLVSQPGAAVVRLRYRSSVDEDGQYVMPRAGDDPQDILIFRSWVNDAIRAK